MEQKTDEPLRPQGNGCGRRKQPKREHTVEKNALMQVNERVAEIKEDAMRLLCCEDLQRMAASGALTRIFRRIWNAANTIERHTAIPGLLQGYREDALAQVERSRELLEEIKDLGEAPDDLQLRWVALSFECALERIGTYLNVQRIEANRRIDNQQAAKEAA